MHEPCAYLGSTLIISGLGVLSSSDPAFFPGRTLPVSCSWRPPANLSFNEPSLVSTGRAVKTASIEIACSGQRG